MSGLIRQIGSAEQKGKRKAGHRPKWCRTNFWRVLRSIGEICRAASPRIQADSRNFAIFRNWHAPCNPWFITTQSGVTTMKTIAFLSAALILSLSLMAATVVVPVSATQIIA